MSAVEAVKELIDRSADPKSMTQEEALEFYEEIENHCNISAMALREDLQR